ncbi:MAG: hypothetical protein P0S96_06950 [Simkaniaceae bacterium]|nr:hypothetical protein [Candidatus Sacchlamyda saccharinae]
MIIAPSCNKSTPYLQVLQTQSTTDAKIRKISFAVFGALSLTAGYFLFTVGTPISTLLAIPLFIAGGIFLWQVTKIRDYEDPHTLAGYRQAAKTMTLAEIEYMHTRANMSKYEIPLKKDFSGIYRDAMHGKSFTDIMNTYEAYKGSRFTVPTPKEFKAVFKKETARMSIFTVYSRFDIKKLYDYGIVTKRFYGDYTSYVDLCKGREKVLVNARTTYDGKVREALQIFSPVIAQASGDTPSRQTWIERLKREAAHLTDVPPHRWQNRTLGIMTPPSVAEGETVAESLSALYEAHTVFLAKVTAAKENLDGQYKILTDVMARRKQELNERYSEGFTAP